MNNIVIFIIFAAVLCGCYRTENGMVLGYPGYETRNIEVTQTDLEILLKANKLLNDESVWQKDAVRTCGESSRLSLYCSLEKASIEVTGKYVHRQPALQEVRFVIDDVYRNRWKVHRLADFNAHPDTSFEDIKKVIARAIETVNGKLHQAN